jgi:adenylate cyclase
MPRVRALHSAIILLTLAVLGIEYFGREASLDPEPARQGSPAQILRRIAGPLLEAENLMRDAMMRVGRPAAPDPRLVFLALDNDSISISSDDLAMLDTNSADAKSKRALTLMSGGWPWSREIYALTIGRLLGAGARMVIMDMNFPTTTPDDPVFRAALDTYRGRIVIGANFSTGTPRAAGLVGPSLSRPTETLIPVTDPLDDRIGMVNFWPDSDLDDVIRSAQYRMTLSQVTGNPFLTTDDDSCLSLSAQGAIKAGYAGSIPPGYDPQPFRYSGPPGTYVPHSIFEIFAPEYWERNYQDGAFFRGKIVIIGGYGNWQHDEHPTPFGTMPGPELQLNALNALLHHEFLTEAPLPVDLMLAALGGLLPLIVAACFRHPLGRVGAAILINAAWLLAAFELFNHAGLIIAVVAPLALFNINGVHALIHDVMAARREGRRVRETLDRYVSRDVVSKMLDHSEAFVSSLGGTMKPATILFSDIRSFSMASARMDPQELVSQLNEYFSAMVECVFQHDGTLDKFIGDALMAVWGNAHTGGPIADACNALRAADAMRERLKDLNEKWSAEGRPMFKIGIALNYGEVVSGNFGSPHRMEYTVIGDAVNTSWRLQELTKEIGHNLVFGKSVADLVCGEFSIREAGLYALPKSAALARVFALNKDFLAASPMLDERDVQAAADPLKSASRNGGVYVY